MTHALCGSRRPHSGFKWMTPSSFIFPLSRCQWTWSGSLCRLKIGRRLHALISCSLSLKFWMTPTLSSFNSVLRRHNNLLRSRALLAPRSHWLHDNSIIFATRVQFCFASCYVVCCLRALTLDLGVIIRVRSQNIALLLLKMYQHKKKGLCFVIYDWTLFTAIQLLILFMGLGELRCQVINIGKISQACM